MYLYNNHCYSSMQEIKHVFDSEPLTDNYILQTSGIYNGNHLVYRILTLPDQIQVTSTYIAPSCESLGQYRNDSGLSISDVRDYSIALLLIIIIACGFSFARRSFSRLF